MDEYIQRHIARGLYTAPAKTHCVSAYDNIQGWRDYFITPHVLFSHRQTKFSPGVFPDWLHSADRYELVVFISGHVSFISGDTQYTPENGSIFLSPPGQMHTTRLAGYSLYDRYVYYINEQAAEGLFPHLLDFFSRGALLALDKEERAEILSLLAQTENALKRDEINCAVLATGNLLRLLYMLDHAKSAESLGGEQLPSCLREVKQYMDENYASVTSVSELAEKLFYSREYISRMFREYFNVSPANYLARRRVEESRKLLRSTALPIAEVGYSVGFGSVSAFIHAFKAVTGMPPSWYRKQG